MPPREEKPPEPGYIAPLLGDDPSAIMRPILTVMLAAPMLTSTQALTLGMGAAMSLNQSMKAPGLPTLQSPFVMKPPKIFG